MVVVIAYVLALKGNQGALSEQVESCFSEANKTSFEGLNVDYYETKEVSRNRYEIRRHWTLNISETRNRC